MLKYFLDTNICIYTIKNKSQEVRDAFYRHYGQFAISSITLMVNLLKTIILSGQKLKRQIIRYFH